MRLIFLLLLQFIPFASYAQNGADLSEQFQKKVTQQYGGTCHVFSASELLESYCYRRMSQRVSLSRDYFVYLHVQSEFASYKSYTPAPDFLKTPLFDDFTDGGDPMKTLTRFSQGIAVSSSEFPTQRFRQIIQTEKMNFSISHFLDRMKSLTQKTLDPTLLECMNYPFKIVEEEFTLKRATELLDAHIPFICNATRWAFKSGTTGPHSIVISGYRKSLTGTLDFQTRDTFDPTQDRWGNTLTEGEEDNSCGRGIISLSF